MANEQLHEVVAHIYTKLVKARRYRNADEYSDAYKLCTALCFECYGMVHTLLILELISKDRYILLNKAIDTFDLSIIEEYAYKLGRSTK